MILCFGKKKYFLDKRSVLGWVNPRPKIFLYFFSRFKLSKCKVWVFFGVLIFNFLSTVGLTTGSQGQFSDPNLKTQNFNINYIWVVLTMFPVILRKKIFTEQNLPWSTRAQKIFFLKNRLKHVMSTFYVVLHDFVFWKKKKNFFGKPVQGQKFFVFFWTIWAP